MPSSGTGRRWAAGAAVRDGGERRTRDECTNWGHRCLTVVHLFDEHLFVPASSVPVLQVGEYEAALQPFHHQAPGERDRVGPLRLRQQGLR